MASMLPQATVHCLSTVRFLFALATEGSLSAADAAAAAEEARAAANATGVVAIRTTYAQALADIASFAEDAYVEVITDETHDDARTRYQVVSGALVYRVNMDQWRLDLGNPAKGTGIVYHRQPGLTAPLTRAAAAKLGDSKSLCDAVDPGLADATEAINVAVRDAITGGFGLDLSDGGTYNVRNIVLNDYTLASPAAGDYQREHIRAFRGRGGLYSAPTFSALDGTTGYVVRGRNAAGVSVGGFRVDARGLCSGVDLSWVGGGQSNGSAPSNRNRINDIWVSNFLDVGVNLDQCHDTDISGINTASGLGADPVAVYLRGAGGFIALRDSTLYGGKLVMGCQNGSLTNVVLSGLELTGGSYNHVAIRSCHFIALAPRGYAIKSSAIGNATRALSVDGCAFIDTGMETGYIQGRYWQGGFFRDCLFLGGVITSDISPAAGSGQPPVFVFENCSFNVDPVTDNANAVHVFINCRSSTGARFTRSTSAVSWHNINRLLVNTETGNASEAATISGGWLRVGSNSQGILPSDNQGIGLGWNYSNGRGEGVIAINGGSGSIPGLDVITHTGGVATRISRATRGAHMPGENNVTNLGAPEFLYAQVFAAIGSINQSDGTLKQDIQTISDAVLDAWAEVPIIQFRWKESVLAKGDDARIHFGLIAQSIRDTFAARGIDATRFGLLCYNEWEDIYEDVMEMVPVLDDEGTQVYENGEPKMETRATGERRLLREAGELWSIRPDQCAFLDVALARRERQRLRARVDALEARG